MYIFVGGYTVSKHLLLVSYVGPHEWTKFAVVFVSKKAERIIIYLFIYFEDMKQASIIL